MSETNTNTPIHPAKILMENLGINGCFSWDGEARFLADTVSIVQPKRILETGFFRGASSFMFLTLSDAHLTTVDPMVNLYDSNTKHDGCLENVGKLQTHFPVRFTFIQKDSRDVRPDLAGQQFDLFFIDGDHWDSGIRNDLDLALELNIPWILMDDFVTNVSDVYGREYAHLFDVVRVYPRPAQFQGRPIPIVLAKRKDEVVYRRLKEGRE